MTSIFAKKCPAVLTNLYAAGLREPKRTFYRMLNAVFNRPDQARIKEVGPDQACAEWLIRCGAQIRWKDTEKFHVDYNTLPQRRNRKFAIEEINADEAAVMELGFPHFTGCNHIKKIRFYHCPYFEDTALLELVRLKDSLVDLEIGSCGDITDRGLLSLTQLQLQKLLLYDLPSVKDKQGCYSQLQKALQGCDITYKDIMESSQK